MPAQTRPGWLGFVQGDFLRYRFAQSRAILSTAPNYAGPEFEAPQLETRMTLSGLLSVTVYEADKNGWLVGFRMTGIECTFASGDQSADPGLEMDGEGLVRRHEQGWGKSPDPIEEILDRVAADDPSEMVRERARMLRKSIEEPEEQA